MERYPLDELLDSSICPTALMMSEAEYIDRRSGRGRGYLNRLIIIRCHKNNIPAGISCCQADLRRQRHIPRKRRWSCRLVNALAASLKDGVITTRLQGTWRRRRSTLGLRIPCGPFVGGNVNGLGADQE